MSDIVLYAAPGSCARVTAIALEEAGADYEYRLVRFLKGEHKSPAYMAINPLGKVPSLQMDGAVFTENVAILNYLARRFPDADLLPRAIDETERAQQTADLCFCSSTLHPIVTRIRIPFFFADGGEAIRSVYDKAVEAMRPAFALIEMRLANGRWWYGDSWSVMDAYIYWVYWRVAGAGFPVAEFPFFVDHAARMEAREAVKRALAREKSAEQQLEEEGLNFRPPELPTT